jgi:hypothetical protein
MFSAWSIASVNRPHELPDGTYQPQSSIFRGLGFQARLNLYLSAETGDICAADLYVVLDDGAGRARDFLRLPDRRWRDSNGWIRDQLSELLPPELLGMKDEATTDLSPLVIHEGRVIR